jgi:hypothetical protein
MHVLPSGFHRIRYYGFLTCQTRANNIERIRELLAVPLIPVDAIKAASDRTPRHITAVRFLIDEITVSGIGKRRARSTANKRTPRPAAAPAVQEESDYQRNVRVQSCIRPLNAAVRPLALM